jgi:transcriptional regulator with XRE-family HTH domain
MDSHAAEGVTAEEPPRRALAKIGRGVLRLRLYWGWSQKELERRSGVDQTTISRLEHGIQRGLSIRKLGRILDALRVDEVTSGRPPTVPQTDLEIMLYGDRWKRAVEEADRRLYWPKPIDPAAGIEDAG